MLGGREGRSWRRRHGYEWDETYIGSFGIVVLSKRANISEVGINGKG